MVTCDLSPDSETHTQISILQRNSQNFLSSFIHELYDVTLSTREFTDIQSEAQYKHLCQMDLLVMWPFFFDS